MTGTRGIHHIGVAVLDVKAAIERYALLVGASVDHEAVVVQQGVHAVALRAGDGPLIELLAATGDDTPVGRFLAKPECCSAVSPAQEQGQARVGW